METITPKTRMSFGKYRGIKIITLDPGYLKWMVETFKDTDKHLYGVAAEQALKMLAGERQDVAMGKRTPEEELRRQANEILRNAGRGDLVNDGTKRRSQNRR